MRSLLTLLSVLTCALIPAYGAVPGTSAGVRIAAVSGGGLSVLEQESPGQYGQEVREDVSFALPDSSESRADAPEVSRAGVSDVSTTDAPEAFLHRSGEVDLFMGVDFNYKDITFERQYDLLIHLTPGVKWYFGRHWTLAAQALIPIVNTYGSYYSRIRPGVVSLSREFSFGDKFYLKASGGLFSRDRYGLDAKMILPLAEWFALEGQVGLTGWWGMYDEVLFSVPKKVTGTIGGSFWLKRWNTQLRGAAGRYINGDWGAAGEVFRHFRHTSVGLYGQWSDLGGWNAGFRVVIMLPPYRYRHHAVNFRPASNFRFTYNYGADPYFNKMYATDPEENERDGWFSRDVLDWGTHTMSPDFTVKKEGRR